MVFNVPSGHAFMTKITIYNAQKALTPKVSKPQLWFLYSAWPLTVNIYVFSKNILKGFQDMGQIGFCDRQIWQNQYTSPPERGRT